MTGRQRNFGLWPNPPDRTSGLARLGATFAVRTTQLARAKHLAVAVAFLTQVSGSACSSTTDDASEVDSPCKAFAAAPEPRYELEPFANVTDVKRLTSGTRTYALDGAGKLYVLAPTSLSIDLGPEVRAVAGSADGTRLYVLKGVAPVSVVRFTSPDRGATFDSASASPVVEIATTGARPDGGALAIDRSGVLWVATPGGSADPTAQDDASRLGKVLRVSGDAEVEIFARGFRGPSGIDVDPESGDVWVTDSTADGDEIDRVLRGKSYGWPVLDGLRCFTPADGCLRDGHVAPVAIRDASSDLVVHRGGVSPLAGKVVFAGKELAALSPFSASGTAGLTKLGVSARTVGRGAGGELLVATADAVLRVKDVAPSAPKTLLATGCFDPASPNGAPAGAIPYEVSSPLWSDGAEKSRFVVVPKGARGRSLPDGDIRFPVGTVAVKNFVVDGKRTETRLFIQHALETWVGYSYAWNDSGTDAELVIGNKTKPLDGGQSWYFPSPDDCMACHTPAAGYTLGIEARQLGGAAVDALDKKLLAPIDRARFPALASAAAAGASAEARARGYLHANCSMCHRDGSSTGVAELDLRIDIPLARTGLCDPPKAGAFGIEGARVVAPGDPARSVLLHRMKSLDEARMPKLGSHVVDEAAAAAVQQWIAGLGSCP